MKTKLFYLFLAVMYILPNRWKGEEYETSKSEN